MDDFNDEMFLEEEITFVHDINRERRINRRRRDAYYKNRRKKAVLHYPVAHSNGFSQNPFIRLR